MRIIAVDPGTRLCGYATFVDGEPVAAGVAKSMPEDTLAQRAAYMARTIALRCRFAPDVVVVERPVIYPDSRERDADIVDLAVTAGVVGGALRARSTTSAPHNLIMPTPREWKGSVPKKIHNERTREKCPAAVALVERDVPKGQRNHVWDAVGLALWQLGR